MENEDTAPTWLGNLVSVLRNKPAILIPVILFAGIVFRVLVLPNPGFEADISFWKSWGLAQYDHGIVWSIENTNNNYPTAFAYVLGAMTRVYSLFADPHNYYEYWSNNNLLFLTISKLPSVLADIGIVFLILYIGKNAGKLGFPKFPFGVYVLISALYLLNPISLIDGAWWGQVDSLGVFVYLLAVVAALKKKPYLAGLIYMASMMTKLQNMVYGPVFFVFLWQLTGYNGLIRGIAGALTGFIGFNYEFFLARKMNLVFEALTVNYDYFPFMSLNAYNLWWIVARADGMHTLDKFTMVGLVNAKTMGLFMFSSGYLLAVILMAKETIARMFKNGKQVMQSADTQVILYRFFSAMMIVASVFFLFQTESHDRYAFPVAVYLLLWGMFFIHTSATVKERENIWDSGKLGKFVIWYLIFSVVYFFNLHTAMIDNYPQNGIGFLVPLNTPELTTIASYLQLGLFAVFLFALFRHVSPFYLTFPLGAMLILLLMTNMPLLLGRPVPLTAFFPIISQQGYLKRQTDMSVNSAQGIQSWNPLSVQYYFYEKGVGTHAKSYHQYNINGQFSKFTTDYGIDTEAGANASATFEIYGDDKPLFVSEKKGRFDKPGHVEVDVTGVEMLGLVTNDGGDGVNDDHTDWLNPILWQ